MLKGFKTLIFSALVMVIGALETLDVTQFLALVGEQYHGAIIAAIGFLVAILRLITKTPVGGK